MTHSVMKTYAPADVVFDKGEGVYLIAEDGKRFLDFGAGVAVTCLGHAHPHLVSALTEQAQKLWHCSNLYKIKGQERFARRLADHTFADVAFSCNSGAEANECAIKIARKYFAAKGSSRNRILTFEGAFHGRTMATLSAGKQAKHCEGFGPLLDGFDQVALNDLDAAAAAITDQTAAVLVEPIQGEGGMRPADIQFLQGLRKLCDDHGILLMLDEVQTGVGRTGKLFAHEWAGITPDVMAIAKGIGGGFPVGACLATNEAASGMAPGSHGSTYGGNPLAMAAANAVLDVILEVGFLEQVTKMGELLKSRLEDVVAEYPDVVTGVRGRGLMLALECKVTNMDLVGQCFNNGLLAIPAGDNVMRMLPPLVVHEEHIEAAIAILKRSCSELSG
ncbi:aspartate aminotransferase family protein [Terasakiella sp. A23]|uniref:aspartate aminotransferase family protein n=1 Tax=Terasakiella sp. FCG-A23 TaxID=3080561 RepID=UPI0029539285|nr:aspartate aminotransferase family protein [Terasakiella sp. A23]MDV7341598.1 aspartate aminotransferase family protein [Terasakiella sp. A23]